MGQRIGAARQAANPGHTGAEPYNRFLAVSFPADRLWILAVNRLVRDLNGLDTSIFLVQVAERFVVAPSPNPSTRPNPGSSGSIWIGPGIA